MRYFLKSLVTASLLTGLVITAQMPAYAQSDWAITVPVSQSTQFTADIEGGPWTSLSEGQNNNAALYVLHLRTCPHCRNFLNTERKRLLTGGVDIRIFPFPSENTRVDDIAFLAYVRHKELLDAYDAKQNIDAPQADRFQIFIDAYNDNLKAVQTTRTALKSQNKKPVTPTFMYKNTNGQWRIMTGYTEEAFAPIRNALLQQARR